MSKATNPIAHGPQKQLVTDKAAKTGSDRLRELLGLSAQVEVEHVCDDAAHLIADLQRQVNHAQLQERMRSA